MSLIEEISKKLEDSELNFIDKVIKENKINLIYQDYDVEEDRKFEELLKFNENIKRGICIMSGCSNKKLNQIYGFEISKDYENKFKYSGLEIITIFLC
jgi:hypothetical protein